MTYVHAVIMSSVNVTNVAFEMDFVLNSLISVYVVLKINLTSGSQSGIILAFDGALSSISKVIVKSGVLFRPFRCKMGFSTSQAIFANLISDSEKRVILNKALESYFWFWINFMLIPLRCFWFTIWKYCSIPSCPFAVFPLVADQVFYRLHGHNRYPIHIYCPYLEIPHESVLFGCYLSRCQ